MSYNKEKVSAEFQRGRTTLDRGNYDEAIQIFSALVEQMEPYMDEDEDAKVTWSTALNNKGIAKCKLAYSNGDKELYESGLEDFRSIISTYPEQERNSLTAYSNLINGENELKDFDTRKVANFRFWNR